MNNRNLALDGLRGLFLVIMAVNHLFGGFVRRFTAEPFGPASAAEGFVLLSGIMFAMVYGQRKDLAQLTKQRLWFVYRWQIIGVLAIFASCFLAPSFYEHIWAPYFGLAEVKPHFWQVLIASLTLTYVPSYQDVLVIYLLSIALAGIGLHLLRHGLGWLWLLISGLLWLSAKWLNADLLNPILNLVLPDISASPGYFDILAWQFLFQIGLVLGYQAKYQERNFYVDNRLFNIGLVASIALITLLWQLHKNQVLDIQIFFSFSDSPWHALLGNNAPELGLMRIGYSLMLAYAALLLVKFLPQLLSGKYFVFLGQHSIQVYVFHAVAVYWLSVVVYPINQQFWWADLLISIGFALLLLLPAYLHHRWQRRTKHG